MTDAEKEEWALRQVNLIGVTPAQGGTYREMLDAARRGWPAWRIAQAWALQPELIYRLGGPAPTTNN